MSVANAVRNPLTYLRGAVRSYRLLLFDPGRFFQELDNRGLRKELAIVFVVGVIGTAGPYYAYTVLMKPFTTGVAYGGQIGITAQIAIRLQGQGLEPFVYTVGIWLAISILGYYGSWVYNERGRFRHLLKNAAWGLVPYTVGLAIQTIAFAMVASGIETETNNPNVWFRQLPGGSTSVRVQYIWGQVADKPIVVGASAVSLVFLVWSWYIWSHALVDVRKIERRKAMLVMGVITVLVGAYLALPLLPF